MGAIIFYPISASLFVPLMITAISLSIHGLMIAGAESRSTFRKLLVISSIMGMFFVPAIINYQWLGVGTLYNMPAYDALYHYGGYFGSIILVIVVAEIARRRGIGSVFISLAPVAIGALYLVFAAQLSAALGVSTQSSWSASSGSVDSNPISFVIGVGYALLMVVVPALYALYVSKNQSRLIEKRNAKIAFVAPRNASGEPYSSASMTQPLAPSSNASAAPSEFEITSPAANAPDEHTTNGN